MAARSLGLYLLLVVFFTSSLYAEEGRTCSIQSMVGDVKVQRKGAAKWLPARPGMPLRATDAIRTFVESEAVLLTSEGTTLTLGENGTMELSQFGGTGAGNGATKTSVRILNGPLVANVKKLVGTQSSFDFHTPTAVASIRGTRVGFDVGAEKTEIKVYEGRVLVTPAGAREGAELVENQQTSVAKGQKTVVVEKMADPKGVEPVKSILPDSGASLKAVDTTAARDSVMKKDSLKIAAVAGLQPSRIETDSQPSVNPVAEAVEKEVAVAEKVDTLQNNTTPVTTNPVVAKLSLVVKSPADRATIDKATVRVAGVTTPGAEVLIGGTRVAVGADGSFGRDVFFPDEEGDYQVDVEAVLGSQSLRSARTVLYRFPATALVCNISTPTQGQVVCDQRVSVSGNVKSPKAEIYLNDRKVANVGGAFSDVVVLPAEPGDHDIRVDVSLGSATRSEVRTVKYDPAGSRTCNTDVPVIGGSLPASSSSRILSLAVTDATPFDELTVTRSIDGTAESEGMAPGARFTLELEEGQHRYDVDAVDKAGNRSARLSGTVSYMSRTASIALRQPASGTAVMRIPPAGPDGGFTPTYTISFDVTNLPGDDPALVKEIVVSGSSPAQTLRTLSSLTGIDVDVPLSRGIGRWTIEVRDIADRLVRKDITIEVK